MFKMIFIKITINTIFNNNYNNYFNSRKFISKTLFIFKLRLANSFADKDNDNIGNSIVKMLKIV